MKRVTAFDLLRCVVWCCFAVYVGLFVFNKTTRTGRFSPDSMNYVNVARNIAAGKGITQPTLGFNQSRISVEDDIPAPLIAQPPAYPLMIALISGLGGFAPVTALAVSAVAIGFIFILAYALAATLYSEEAALTSLGLLLFYGPLRYLSGFAWSDPIGIALTLFCLLLLARESPNGRWPIIFGAGLVAGLAFATRYALFPLFAVGILFLFLSSQSGRKMRDICLYGVGFTLPAGFVWAQNFAARGVIMPPSRRAPADFFETMSEAFHSICARYVTGIPASLQCGLLVISIIACAIPLLKSGTGQRARSLLLANKRYILLLWSLGYLVFIIAQRSAWYFGYDRANEMLRVAAPAGVVLLICWTGLVVSILKVPRAAVLTLVFLLLSLSVWREARVLAEAPRLDFQQPIPYSERLAWIATHASNDDLIIGEDSIDIPFFLPGRQTVSFSPYPVTQSASYELIWSYSLRHCAAYRNIYIVLSSHGLNETEWRTAYGDFFADLMFGQTEKYPGIDLIQQLNDASVFSVSCR